MTTEEFLLKELEGLNISSKLINQNKFKAIAILNKFAQYHVTQALKKAAEEVEMTYESFDKSWWIDEDSILNAYPKELIK